MTKKVSTPKKSTTKKDAEAPAAEAAAPVTAITKIESEIKPLSTEVISLREAAEKMIIESDEHYAAASDALDVVNSKSKSLDKLRKFFVDPLNKQVKDINAMFKPQIDSADQVVAIIKGKMAAYYDKKEKARLAEEARLQKIRDAADAKREEKGLAPIAEPVREVAAPQKTIATGNSKAQVRKVWTCEIEHIDQLPDDVKKAIFAEAYKKGIIKSVVQGFVDAGVREMTGVRIFEETRIASGNVRQW